MEPLPARPAATRMPAPGPAPCQHPPAGPRTTQRSGFQRHRRKILSLLLLFTVVAADVLGTALLKALGLYTPVATAEAAYRRADPVYHHGLRPNMQCEDGGTWGHLRYTVRTNSLGFKDAAVREVVADSSSPRILLIGDSFTEGVGYPFEQTFAGILAAELGEQGVEVLNAGCSTYAPVIYRRRVQELLETQRLRFDHLVVCLDMSDIVDEIKYYRLGEQGNVVRRVEGVGATWKQFVADHTILLNRVRNWIHDWRETRRTGDRQVVDHERSSWTRDPSLWARYGQPGLASADLHLDALWQMLKQSGIPLSLVVYPWPDQILNAERDCAQVTYWRDWCATRSVQFIDAFPAFLDAGPPVEVIAEHFIPKDMHWNERGHALMAKVLLPHLRQ